MTYENKKILSFSVLTFTKAELDELGDDLTALIATMSYAANEISTMQLLYISNSGVVPADKDIYFRWAIQKHTLIRILNAKVFEAIFGFSEYKKTLERRGLHKSLEFLAKIFEQIDDMKHAPGYNYSKAIRDKATNHYSPANTKKNMKYVSARADKRMIHHEKTGNSFHPIGEEYVFMAQVNATANTHNVQSEEVMNEWIDWTIRSLRTLSKAFDDLLIQVVTEVLPHKYLELKKPYVELPLVCNLTTSALPLFFESTMP
ncbi:hypothetical protein [Celeribacter baekdonensis]|uniref:hypothetical protein n=1 Tax=Celeribacter baekdonensis TaxID=875171 RepID=UPI003A8F2A73